MTLIRPWCWLISRICSSTKRRRIIIQDVEQRVVLDGRQRQLQDIADEIRHHRAASAALRLEMRGVRNRHVVRKLKGVEPRLLAVHRARAEAIAAEFARVVVDALGLAQERVLVGKQAPIVIQVVQIDFETTPAQLRRSTPPHFFAALGDELKCRLDAQMNRRYPSTDRRSPRRPVPPRRASSLRRPRRDRARTR